MQGSDFTTCTLSTAELETRLEGRLGLFLPEPVQPLHQAMHHVVFSGGKRIRPHLLLRVALASGIDDGNVELALRAACALELVHSASLVHDDLPCFDDAAERRGRPTAHVLYGVPIAVLTGDALLTLAFEILADVPEGMQARALLLVRMLGHATGAASGIIGGQSMELSDGGADPALIQRYHAMKTSALFRFAAEAGAVAASSTVREVWVRIGEGIGAWYQLADDLADVRADARLARPNAVATLGKEAVVARMNGIFDEVTVSVRLLSSSPEPLLELIAELRMHLRRIVQESL